MHTYDSARELTDTQAAFVADFYDQYRTTAPADDMDIDPVERGALGSLVAGDVLTRVDAGEQELLEDLVRYNQRLGRPLFSDPSDVQRYEADIDSFDPETFGELHRDGLLQEYGGLTVTTAVGEDVLETDAEGELYAFTPRGRSLIDDAPLPYRHPHLLERYQELQEEHGGMGDIVTVFGRTKVGSSYVADVLSDGLDMPVFSAGDYFRELAQDLYPGEDEEHAVVLLEEQLDTADGRQELTDEIGMDPDVKLDSMMMEAMFEQDEGIFDGRMAGIIAYDDAPLRINVVCADDRAAKRLADADTGPDTVDAAREQIMGRRERLQRRYQDMYGVDITDTRFYNMEFDNTPEMDRERRADLVVAARERLRD